MASDATLTLIEGVLDFIRANLANIERTWGKDSAQYRSTMEIMQQYFDNNLKQLREKEAKDCCKTNVNKDGVHGKMELDLDLNLEDLLAGLSLRDTIGDRG